MNVEFLHPDWSSTVTPQGREMIFRPKPGGAAFLVPLIAAAVIAVPCLYFIWLIAGGWLQGEEVLPGGVVFVLLCVGGLLFARRCVRLAFRQERYLLTAAALRIFNSKSGALPAETIERQSIVEVLQVYTPPKESGQKGIWRTAVVHHDSKGSRKEHFLEGFDEDVCDFLSSQIVQWAGGSVQRRTVNTFD